MELSSAAEPFDRENWNCEMKLDGYRLLAEIEDGQVRILSRNRNVLNKSYPPIVRSLRRIETNMILDGELVATDRQGIQHVEWLRGMSSIGFLTFVAFDLLYVDRRNAMPLPQKDRKALLEEYLPRLPNIVPILAESEGTALFREVERRGLEGVVYKNPDSPYKPGTRSKDWIKVKTPEATEAVKRRGWSRKGR